MAKSGANVRVSLAIALSLLAFGGAQSALAGSFTPPSTPPTPPRSTPPVIVVTHPDPPPPRIPPPIINLPHDPGTVPVIQGIDTTHLIQAPEASVASPGALAGIKQIADFPTDVGREGKDFLLVRGADNSRFEKTSSYSVKFLWGEVIASTRHPSRVGLVNFELGDIALSPDADVMLKRDGDVYRIVNFDGRGETVKIKLTGGGADAQDAKVIALAPGYELVASSRTLKHTDIRIADGCARRHFKLLDDGHAAVCEISTESILTSSSLVANLHKEDESRKLVGDMSKMAAVLNYVNGTDGYTKDATPDSVAGGK